MVWLVEIVESFLGIKAANEILPHATGVVVLDTAFHQTMPEENY